MERGERGWERETERKGGKERQREEREERHAHTGK